MSEQVRSMLDELEIEVTGQLTSELSFEVAMRELSKLLQSDSDIRVKDIPSVFLNDIKKFMIGQTMCNNSQGDQIIYYRDFRSWYDLVFYKKGFDYAIQFKKFK